jgi:hypothetical protein
MDITAFTHRHYIDIIDHRYYYYNSHYYYYYCPTRVSASTALRPRRRCPGGCRASRAAWRHWRCWWTVRTLQSTNKQTAVTHSVSYHNRCTHSIASIHAYRRYPHTLNNTSHNNTSHHSHSRYITSHHNTLLTLHYHRPPGMTIEVEVVELQVVDERRELLHVVRDLQQPRRVTYRVLHEGRLTTTPDDMT